MRTRAMAFGGLAILASAGLATEARATPELVVLSGTPVPGQPAGVHFDFFSDPRINSTGAIAFWAQLAGPGVTPANAGSVWMIDGKGGLMLVRRAGDPSPVTGHHYGALPSFAFNDLSRFAFTASLVNTAAPNHPLQLGMFATDPSGPGLLTLAVEGQPSPGLPNENWSGLPLPQLASRGGGSDDTTSFHANNGRGLWRFADGLVNLRHAAGELAPGSTLAMAFLDEPVIASGGDFVFRASLAQPGTSEPISSGLFTSVMEQTEPVAFVGDQAPGLAAGITFAEFTGQPASAPGRLAFWAKVDGPGTSASNNTGIWFQQAGMLDLLSRAGDQAPGTPGGVVFGSFARQIALAPDGTIAFSATLTGPGVTAANNTGIWIRHASSSSLTLLAREGDQVPRTLPGTEFSRFGPVYLNDAGQAAFTAYLGGSSVTSVNNFGLFATDLHKKIWPIVRRGDQLDVGGTMRTVAEIIFDGGQPSAGQSQFAAISYNGVLIYKLRFITPPPAVMQALYTSTIGCPANCDGSTSAPVLNVDDFTCFINSFASAQNLPHEQQLSHPANCDGSTSAPVLNIEDFTCFINAFAAGCL